MKLALLNLQYDSNFGGNLQRYALMKVLQDMGHDVTHLNLRTNYIKDRWFTMTFKVIRRCFRRFIMKRNESVFPERYQQRLYKQSCRKTEPFYNRYIRHTKPIYTKAELTKYALKYDAFIVGSDQVWRKAYCCDYGKGTFFLDFLPPNAKVRRIAYAASMGTDAEEWTKEEIKELKKYYQRFNFVSVREQSSLKLLEQYQWQSPKAIQTLDPTLLLDAKDYIDLINRENVKELSGKMLCYILDSYEDKVKTIETIAKNMHLKPFRISPYSQEESVEQFLKSFQDAEYVVTDSYHGLIFSILFHKPFYLFNNETRGKARFQSLIDTVLKNVDVSNIDWNVVDENIRHERSCSLQFLRTALSS